jgi:non-specific serine/threonine protein kinase
MGTNLPYHLTSFIGRKEELEQVKQLLTHRRLVTLLGPGGIGKTRLALQVAAACENAFPDGVWLVELASLRDPALIPQVMLDTCNIRDVARSASRERLIQAFRSRHLLLVLDNCEHLLSACALLSEALLRNCAQVSLLVTSREALQITGEALWPLAGLEFPDAQTTVELPHLMEYDAIHFFVDRARAVIPRFMLTAQNAPAVVQVCMHLDGIPLAIELAAARLPMLTVEQLAARVDERFRLLTAGSRVADQRHQTLQATLDWSYDLLLPIERIVFCRLSIFSGSWTLEAFEGICSDSRTKGLDLLDLLTHLVNKSLVVAETFGDVVRYRLLETVQQYAQLRQREYGEKEQLYERHWNWYLKLAEEARPHLQGPAQQQWLARLESESENLRLALERSLAAGQVEITARIACALERFWVTRSKLSEGRFWYEALLAQPELALLLRLQVLQQATEILRFQGEYERMRALLDERVALVRELDEPALLAETLNSMGWMAFYRGDSEEAQRLCSEGLLLYRQMDDRAGIATSLGGLALVATLQRAYPRALELLQEAVAIRRHLQDHASLAYALNAQARAAALHGEEDLARSACLEALELTTRLRQPFGTAYNLEVGATIASVLGHTSTAVQLFSAAQVLRQRFGVPQPPSLRSTREQELLPLRLELGEEAFARHWSQGQALSPEQARALSREMLEDPATRRGAGAHYPAGLSQREVDVLCLVALGYTDAQVARELVLSPRTVSAHLRTIYRKIEVNSRVAATYWAQEHHLLSHS